MPLLPECFSNCYWSVFALWEGALSCWMHRSPAVMLVFSMALRCTSLACAVAMRDGCMTSFLPPSWVYHHVCEAETVIHQTRQASSCHRQPSAFVSSFTSMVYRGQKRYPACSFTRVKVSIQWKVLHSKSDLSKRTEVLSAKCTLCRIRPYNWYITLSVIIRLLILSC